METIKVKDLFPRTGLRHCKISDNSGEEFYHKYLNEYFKKCYDKNEVLLVDLDGVRGYSPSFIDEAFGNLVFDFSLKIVKKYLEIKSDNFKFWKESILTETYKIWEIKREKDEFPIKTELHDEWWRLTENGLQKSVWIRN
jgi:hypothetical protein